MESLIPWSWVRHLGVNESWLAHKLQTLAILELLNT
jgi:hypothetical protein